MRGFQHTKKNWKNLKKNEHEIENKKVRKKIIGWDNLYPFFNYFGSDSLSKKKSKNALDGRTYT